MLVFDVRLIPNVIPVVALGVMFILTVMYSGVVLTTKPLLI